MNTKKISSIPFATGLFIFIAMLFLKTTRLKIATDFVLSSSFIGMILSFLQSMFPKKYWFWISWFIAIATLLFSEMINLSLTIGLLIVCIPAILTSTLKIFESKKSTFDLKTVNSFWRIIPFVLLVIMVIFPETIIAIIIISLIVWIVRPLVMGKGLD